MTVQIQRPPGIDVSVNNPGTILYLRGNVSTDGSIRYEIVQTNGSPVTEIQQRKKGLWQPTSFKTGAQSVKIGTLLGLGAAGSHLITTDDADRVHFHSRSELTNGVSTSFAKMLNAFAFVPRVVFRSDESSTFIGTVIENITIDNQIHLITGKFFFKTGEKAASQPVLIEAWDGVDDTGLQIFDQEYPASDFPANTEIALTLEGFLEFNIGDDTFTRISSAADFSLLGAPTDDAWWLAVDSSFVKDDDLLQTTEWVSGDTFTQGDWSTQKRKVYVCNVTGIQTGTFDSNLDKWDVLLSSGDTFDVDTILTNLAGDVLINNDGNVLVNGS